MTVEKQAPQPRSSTRAQASRELGRSGLQQFGGIISEEWLRNLQGERGARVFREMRDNDPTIGAILFAVEMLLREVEWRVEPFSDDPLHQEQAEVVESLRDDMSHTWEDLIAEVLSMLVFGYAPLEIVYKRREGPAGNDPSRRSRHSDGLIGWRKLALRAQDSIERWQFDEEGGVEGLHQATDTGHRAFIPIEKLLIFRTTSKKSNPEGRSVIRNAFLPWYYKKKIEQSEAIGVERDLAGMPLFYLPDSYWNTENSSTLAAFQKIVDNIKQDEHAGLLLPAIFDESGNRLLEFQLASTGGRRLFDTSKIVQRYDRQIATTLLADFVLLGHEKVGSFSLSSDKTSMFSTALGAWLKEIASVLNRHALPRLYRLNGWDPSETAFFVPEDLEKPDVERWATAISNLVASGGLVLGSEEDEAHFRSFLNLPELKEGRPSPTEEVEP